MDGDPFIRCPKRCDIRTPPERQPDGSWVCAACGHAFTVTLERLRDVSDRPVKARRADAHEPPPLYEQG